MKTNCFAFVLCGLLQFPGFVLLAFLIVDIITWRSLRLPHQRMLGKCLRRGVPSCVSSSADRIILIWRATRVQVCYWGSLEISLWLAHKTCRAHVGDRSPEVCTQCQTDNPKTAMHGFITHRAAVVGRQRFSDSSPTPHVASLARTVVAF